MDAAATLTRFLPKVVGPSVPQGCLRGSPGLFKVRKAGVAGLQMGKFRGDRGRRCKPLLTTGGPRWADMAGHDGQPLLLL